MMPPAADVKSRAHLTLWLFTAAGAVFVLVMVGPFAESMAAGALLAVAFQAPHAHIRRLVHRPGVSAAISTVLMVLLFLAPLSVIVPVLAREVRESIAALQASGSLLERLSDWLDFPMDDLRQALSTRLQAAGEAIVRQGVTAIGIATGGIIQTAVAVGAFYFVIRDGESIHKEIIAMSPLGAERTETLLRAASEMLHASVYGVLGVALAQGVLCGIGVWIAGLPLPMMWGLAAAAVSILPFFGSALVWIPAALTLFSQGRTGMGIFMLAWGGGIVAMADNVVRPWILTTRMSINPLLVMVSMLGSAHVFGIIGFVAGPVVLATFLALLRTLRDEVAAKPVAG